MLAQHVVRVRVVFPCTRAKQTGNVSLVNVQNEIIRHVGFKQEIDQARENNTTIQSQTGGGVFSSSICIIWCQRLN